MYKYHSLFIAFVILAFVGCSQNVKLGGKVTFPDGEPLTSGMIIFSNDDFLARAEIRSDGTYDVGSLAQKDGLPPGTYRVYITKLQVGKREFFEDSCKRVIAG